MSHEIVSHKVNGLNEVLKIEALDDPGPGGAYHHYRISPTVGNALGTIIKFQNGGLQDTGGVPNGLSNEALLAVVEDRLAHFQAGPYPCEENENALRHLRESMMWLQKRTLDRMRRGVEGKVVA